MKDSAVNIYAGTTDMDCNCLDKLGWMVTEAVDFILYITFFFNTLFTSFLLNAACHTLVCMWFVLFVLRSPPPSDGHMAFYLHKQHCDECPFTCSFMSLRNNFSTIVAGT